METLGGGYVTMVTMGRIAQALLHRMANEATRSNSNHIEPSRSFAFATPSHLPVLESRRRPPRWSASMNADQAAPGGELLPWLTA